MTEVDDVLGYVEILKNEGVKYREGYRILSEYFECIPEQERHEVHQRLKEVGL